MANLTPNNGNLYLGAGVLKLDVWSAGAKTGLFYDMGDVSEFSTTMSSEIAEKKTSRTGARGLYKSAVKGVSGEGSLKLSEWAAYNVANAILGTRSDLTQSSTTKTDAAPVSNPAMQKGASCYIGFRGVTSFTLKMAPATALVLGTDYTFDAETGEVTILSTSSTFTNGSKLLWSGTVPAILNTSGRSIITPLSAPMILASIRYKSATDQVSGPRYDIFLPMVQLIPDGAMEWLKDDFSDLGMKIKLMMDTTQAAGQEYGTITEL